jgi:hypothetical protein
LAPKLVYVGEDDVGEVLQVEGDVFRGSYQQNDMLLPNSVGIAEFI